MLVKVTCTWTDLLLLRLAPHQHPLFDVKIRNGRESASLPNASCKYGLSAYFTIAEKGRIKRSTIPFYASVLFNFVSPVTQPSKHTFAKATGLYLGDIDSGRRLRSLKSIQPFSYNLLFWEYLLVHQPYGGINHPGTHTDSQLLLQWFPLKVSSVTEGGLLPSWRAKATQCRAPTSTASLCPPTHTSSHTCWGACHRQPCLVFPSVGTAPPPQPVSKLRMFALSRWHFQRYDCYVLGSVDDCWRTGGVLVHLCAFSSIKHVCTARVWDSFILILFG